jgi:PAS domain S-box-containing protein
MGQIVDARNHVVTKSRQSVFEFSNGTGCLSSDFHGSPHVQAVTSFDTGHYLYVNDNFVSAAGYARADVIGKTSTEIGIVADKLDRRWLTKVLREHGRLDTRKVRFRLRSGDVRMGLFNAEVIKVDGENCILSTVRNISDRFTAEDRHEQKRYALNQVRDAVVALDPQGHITYLNQAAEQLYGWTSAQITGRLARNVLVGDSKNSFDAAWRTLRDEGKWHGQIAQLTRDGERSIESRWSTVCEKQSARTKSILIVSTDNAKADESTVGLAHEIRNPLASIKGVADSFLQRGQLSRQEREWMEAVRHEVSKIDARMREILDVSQPRLFNIKPCSLTDIVSGVVQLARSHVTSINENTGKKISINFIDETTAPLIVHLDPARIEDAVLNLVLNAIESIENSGRVTVCLKRLPKTPNRDAEALIEVTDNGCGISPEIRERIFESRFTTKREGTGLGLPAVRRTADAFHGRITFNTRIGRGTRFVLALPLRTQKNLNEIRHKDTFNL